MPQISIDDLESNRYLQDILSQPDALRLALAKTDLSALDKVAQALAAGKIDRIILTGMGASYYGLYPAWLQLAAAGLPAVWVDAAELVHHVPALVTGRSLLWVASQSGQSAEILALLDQIEARPPAALLAMTNEVSSPLAKSALEPGRSMLGALAPLYAKPEETPSTRTYLHTIAIGQLVALCLAGEQLAPHLAALQATADGIADYLKDWKAHMERIRQAVAGAENSYVLIGRGLSLASAYSGALNLQEAAKIAAIGLQAAEFRHGPLEMAGAGLTVFVFAGEKETIDQQKIFGLNHRLWKELRALKTNAWLLEPSSGSAYLQRMEEGTIPIPHTTGIGLPLAEIIPIQLMCVLLSKLRGFEPGKFRHIGKVTTIE